MKSVLKTLAVAVLMTGLAGAAHAQTTSTPTAPPAHEMGAVRAACSADVKSLCGGTQPGGGRIMQCLKANESKVSPGCQSAMQAAKASHEGMHPGSMVPAPTTAPPPQ